MSILEFRQKKEGAIHQGGSVRAPGEDELDPLAAKGLSQAEIAMREQNEAFNKKELDFLENFLNQQGWRAQDVLLEKKVKDKINLPPWFRYGNLDKHLKTLVAGRK